VILSRRGLSEASEFEGNCFLYIPIEEVDNPHDLLPHHRLRVFFAPVNWVDSNVFGGPSPIFSITWLADDLPENTTQPSGGWQPSEVPRTPEEWSEFKRWLREQSAKNAAIDQQFRQAQDVGALLKELAEVFEAKQYNQSHHTYRKLVEYFENRELTPLFRAYDRSDSIEARIWFATAAQRCGNSGLLRKLGREVHQELKGEAQQRAAIAVAFGLSDGSMVPYLIDALSSDFTYWIDGDTAQSAPSAAYLLTDLTNHFFDDYPRGLLNYSCWIMPPPVSPYPVPILSEEYRGETAVIQFRWRAWWAANRAKSRQQWILDGIERDVRLLDATPDIRNADERVLERIRRYVDLEWSSEPKRALRGALDEAKKRYAIP
jgi:hypothetical protein